MSTLSAAVSWQRPPSEESCHAICHRFLRCDAVRSPPFDGESRFGSAACSLEQPYDDRAAGTHGHSAVEDTQVGLNSAWLPWGSLHARRQDGRTVGQELMRGRSLAVFRLWIPSRTGSSSDYTPDPQLTRFSVVSGRHAQSWPNGKKRRSCSPGCLRRFLAGIHVYSEGIVKQALSTN